MNKMNLLLFLKFIDTCHFWSSIFLKKWTQSHPIYISTLCTLRVKGLYTLLSFNSCHIVVKMLRVSTNRQLWQLPATSTTHAMWWCHSKLYYRTLILLRES